MQIMTRNHAQGRDPLVETARTGRSWWIPNQRRDIAREPASRLGSLFSPMGWLCSSLNQAL